MNVVKKVVPVALLSVLVLASASTLKAFTIESTQFGSNPIFDDDFEGALGDIDGRIPTNFGQFWSSTIVGGGSTNVADSPAAIEGSNFLNVKRAGAGGDGTLARARLDNEHTTGTISADFMLRLEDLANEYAHAAFHNTGGPGYIAGLFIGNAVNGNYDINLTRDLDNSRTLNDLNELGDTGIDFPSDGDWHLVHLEYIRETGTIGVSIDGGTLHTFNDAPGRNIDEFRFFAVAENEFQVDALVPTATTYNWSGNLIGDWHDGQSWTELGLPNRKDHTAILGDHIAAPATVVTNSDVTVRQINFDSPAGYAVSGQGSILLEAQSVGIDAGVQVLQAATAGGHQFQVPVHLGSDATVDVVSNATLTFHNAVILNGNTLTKMGDGTVTISNDLILGGGSVSLMQGTLAGNGTIGGDADNRGGTISPGNNASGVGQAVPEPGALGLLLLAGVACSLLRWNQSRSFHNRIVDPTP